MTIEKKVSSILSSGLAKHGNGFKILFTTLMEETNLSEDNLTIVLNTITQYNAWNMVTIDIEDGIPAPKPALSKEAEKLLFVFAESIANTDKKPILAELAINALYHDLGKEDLFNALRELEKTPSFWMHLAGNDKIEEEIATKAIGVLAYKRSIKQCIDDTYYGQELSGLYLKIHRFTNDLLKTQYKINTVYDVNLENYVFNIENQLQELNERVEEIKKNWKL